MSENIGVICYDNDDDEVFIGRDLAHAKSHSENVASEIDKEVKSIIDDCYAKAKAIIISSCITYLISFFLLYINNV
jgi:cell division protease FtsH